MQKWRLALTADNVTGGDVCRWRGIWGQVVERVLLERGWVPIVLDA